MIIRKATKDDVKYIVEMLADDKLGSTREDYELPLSQAYIRAFQNIDTDSNQELMVVQRAEGEIIGTIQLSFIQYLTYQGISRSWYWVSHISLGYSKNKETLHPCFATHNRQNRPDALRFYENMGLTASHEGMKKYL